MMVTDSSYTTFHCIFCILWAQTKDTETFYGNNNNKHNTTSCILAVPVQGLVTTQGHLDLKSKQAQFSTEGSPFSFVH